MSDHYINEKCPTCGKGRCIHVTGEGDFLLHINRELFRSDGAYLTGKELLELGGLLPVESYAVYQKRKGDSPLRIQLGDRVFIGDELHNRIVTLPLGQTQGAVA